MQCEGKVKTGSGIISMEFPEYPGYNEGIISITNTEWTHLHSNKAYFCRRNQILRIKFIPMGSINTSLLIDKFELVLAK